MEETSKNNETTQLGIGAVISRVTFIGEVPKNRFYQVLEKIDAIKRMGYVFSKHERKDSDGYVQFDYELELHSL